MIGRTIAHYRVLEKLGGGGMGVVYRAEDTNLHRSVALKFLPESLVHDEKALERFEREARAASLLSHPNICSIYEIEEDEGKPVLVMEYLEGQDLKKRISGKALPNEEMLSIGVEMAGALGAAHEQGVIHRDIKPANIFITKNGHAQLLDFGLAKMAVDVDNEETALDVTMKPDDLTSRTGIPGTTVYMSPEQVRKEELDARSDIFSFGIVLYEMATGKKPFHGKTAALTMRAILQEKPASPLALNPNLPEGLESVLGKALEKRREDRYQSASDLRTDLELVQHQTESALQDAASMKAAARYRKTFRPGTVRHIYLQMIVAIFLAAVLLAVTVWWAKQLKPSHAAAVTSKRIAVLPLQNLGSGADDPLRFTLSDAAQEALLHAKGWEVHPIPDPTRFIGKPVEAAEAGHELGVDLVLTGHYVRGPDGLHVTLQAVETATGKLLWQSSFTTEEGDKDALAQQVRSGLIPKL